MIKYINQSIGEKEIRTWNEGERVLIVAGTGTGKSYFVRTVLFKYARRRHKKILWLTNRTILREQVKGYLGPEQEEVIDVINYQNIQEKLSQTGWALLEIFAKYDYVVYDEVHHIFADAGFNRKTDLMLQPLRTGIPGKVLLFMTATPQQVLMYQGDFDHQYIFPIKYDHITSVFFYSKKKTLQYIIENIPEGEKAIYFANRIKDAIAIKGEYSNEAKFICSASNSENKKHISKKTVEEIEQENKFSCKLLCTTRVLDNGIDLKDETIKHIIIDITDPVELIQCIGRKRILSQTDRVKLYIRYRNKHEIQGYLNRLDQPLHLIGELQELGNEGFLEKYKWDDFDNIIHPDMSVNRAKEIMMRYLKHAFESMLRRGYKRYICGILGLPYEMAQNAEEHFQAIELVGLLEEYTDVKLFTPQKRIFQDLVIRAVFNPRRRTSSTRKGIHTIQGIISDDKLPYTLTSHRQTKNPNRNKMYWIVRKIAS